MEDQGFLQMRVLIEILTVITIDFSMHLLRNFIYNAGLYAAIFSTLIQNCKQTDMEMWVWLWYHASVLLFLLILKLSSFD